MLFDPPIEQLGFVDRQAPAVVRAATHGAAASRHRLLRVDRLLPAGTAIANAFTRRIRYLVLRSGAADLHHWREERRDIGADFLRLFGSESPQVPPVVAWRSARTPTTPTDAALPTWPSWCSRLEAPAAPGCRRRASAGAARLRNRALPGVELSVVAPRRALHRAPAGRLRGWHYTLAQCSVPLAPLAERAGARLLQASAVACDLAARSVSLADGEPCPTTR